MNDGTTEIIEQALVPAIHGEIMIFDIRQNLAQAQENIKAIEQFVAVNMVENQDYGPPFKGSDKKTLLKPGAEKLDMLFDVWPHYTSLSTVEVPASGYAFYRYECRLENRITGRVIGSGIGSCNSYETKYRWRQGERLCPNCSKANIRKSKNPEPGNGWYCWTKTDGCGATFDMNDPDITGQSVGRVDNPDIMDTWNTVDKMAQKRALVAASLSMGCVSHLFTQDLEDFGEESGLPDYPNWPTTPAGKPAPGGSAGKSKPAPKKTAPVKVADAPSPATQKSAPPAAEEQPKYYTAIPTPPAAIDSKLLPPKWVSLYDRLVVEVREGRISATDARKLFGENYPEGDVAIEAKLLALQLAAGSNGGSEAKT